MNTSSSQRRGVFSAISRWLLNGIEHLYDYETQKNMMRLAPSRALECAALQPVGRTSSRPMPPPMR
jgi:hypothetical protein